MTKSSSNSSEEIKSLKELLETEKLSRLLEQLYSATGLGNSVIDLKGNILHRVGWKSICSEFHRKHKISSDRCLKSDTIIANRLKKKEKYSIYICHNGMVDAATPIIIEGVHVANFFIGQFFLETPDQDFFIRQAEELGFDQEKYIKALKECQVYDKETILSFLEFFSELINMISRSAQKTIKQEKRSAELIIAKEQAEAASVVISKAWKYNRNLIEASLDPLVTIGPSGIITDVNTATENATGIPREKLIGTDFSGYFTEPSRAQAGYKQTFKDGKVYDYELKIKHISGYSIPVLYNASVYKDDQGEIIGVFAAARDITATRKAEDELIFLKDNLELLVKQRTADLQNVQILLKSSLESTKDMIILSIDQNYNYYYFNEAHKDAMKSAYDKEVAIGMNLLEAITSEPDRINAKFDYDLALKGKTHSVIQKRGGKAVSYYEVFYNPIINDNNEIVGAASFARDVSERILQEEKIKELNNQLEFRVIERTAQLESANKELEAFSYSVSHDLKAPLRHITGYVSLLIRKYVDLLPEEGRRYLENVSFSAKNMGELIDGLLQFSRTGRIDMEQRLFNMNEIVTALIEPIKEHDTERRIEWNISPMPLAYGDPEMIKSAWSNLVENAVKFSKNKSLAKITIGAEESESDIIYYIKDNGAGFDMNYVSKLFSVFQRLHSREDYEGTGIGLATVRRIITRHGGKTWAEGKLGEGATFYFSLIKRKESVSI